MTKQITAHILMVRPANFGYNAETAENNAFQKNDQSLSKEEIKKRAIEEFDAFVSTMRNAGIDIIVAQDTEEPLKTDAVFPNNWLTTHENGAVITYPMYSEMRSRERREDIIEDLGERFEVKDRFHLEGGESQNLYLEGTGSLILDRPNKLAYACTSERTSVKLLDKFCSFTGYNKVLFQAVDRNGIPIYHTNVMMAMGETFVVICMDSIRDPDQNQALRRLFANKEKELIDISLEQMEAFAGNMLQVRNEAGDTFLVMSSQAYGSLRQEQIDKILQHTQILHSPLDIIETYGGGSARCMMAEVFLPLKV
ncbi:MAG: arginine deiminase-related protein [Bacteroidota bacterium]